MGKKESMLQPKLDVMIIILLLLLLSTVYGLQSADPERAVRDPVPLPTSTGITSSKKHVAARVDISETAEEEYVVLR